LFIYLNICTRHKVHEHNVCTTQIDNHRHKRFKAALRLRPQDYRRNCSVTCNTWYNATSRVGHENCMVRIIIQKSYNVLIQDKFDTRQSKNLLRFNFQSKVVTRDKTVRHLQALNGRRKY